MKKPVVILWVGPAVAGAASLGSAFLSGAANKRAAREQGKWNLKLWRLQNEYNHPVAQRQRLEEAGLNPNLVYGGGVKGATGQADQARGYDRESYDFGNPLEVFQDVRMKGAQTNNLEQKTLTERQETALKASNVAGQGIKNARNKFELNKARKLEQTSLDAADQNLRRLEAQAFKDELEGSILSETKKDVLRKAQYEADAAFQNVELKRSQKAGQDLMNTLRNLETELKREGLENSPFWMRWIHKKLKDTSVNPSGKIENLNRALERNSRFFMGRY